MLEIFHRASPHRAARCGVIASGRLFLFQGDSITNAHRMPREPNNAYQLGAGYAMMIAATLLKVRPDAGLAFHNRGVSGDNLPAMAHRWQADCLDLRPDVVSILIGINDTVGCVRGNTQLAADHFDRDYRRLLDTTRAALPDVQLVLCEPFALETGVITADVVADLRRRQAVVIAIAQTYNATYVPLQQAFTAAAASNGDPAYWIYDGIHPTAPGHRLIADQWLEHVVG